MKQLTNFTIITSSLNALSLLEHTANSIFKQSLENWEWIVVDGASNDGTYPWLLKLRAKDWRIKIISESDEGIYDAWNKALPLIKGQWVLFLGAGDQLASNTVLEGCAKSLESVSLLHNLAYGRVELISRVEDTEGDICEQIWEGIAGHWGHGRPSTPNHQGIFHRASMFTQGKKFDTSYRIAGDTAFILPELLKRGGATIDITIALMLKGGVSGSPETKLQLLKEIFRINRHTGLVWKRVHYQYPAFCYQYLKAISALVTRQLQHYFQLPLRRHNL